MQRPWGGWAGLRGEDCPLKTCGAWSARPRRTQIYSDLLGVGGTIWRLDVVLLAPCWGTGCLWPM